MRILLFTLGSILIGSVLPLDAQAPDAASVSLPELSNYPEPHCTKPQQSLVRPTVLNDQFGSVGEYSTRVVKFNRDFKAYSACMHAYIDKANMDVKRIQEVAAADMKQIAERANLSTKAIQNKATQASVEAEGVTADLNAQITKIAPSEGRHR
jgi:hypothetical protein